MVSLARVAWEVARFGRLMVPESQFPISVIAIVRVCFFVGLADSLGKNWGIEWKQFRSAQEAPLRAKCLLGRNPVSIIFLLIPKGTPC